MFTPFLPHAVGSRLLVWSMLPRAARSLQSRPCPGACVDMLCSFTVLAVAY